MAVFYFQLNQKNIPKTLTLPLALAGSVSKPKLSHSVKFNYNIHKENQGDFFFQLKRFQLKKENMYL